MKSILRFFAVLAAVNMAGRVISSEEFRLPSISETAECLHDIASEVMEFAEKFGCTFDYSTKQPDLQ